MEKETFEEMLAMIEMIKVDGVDIRLAKKWYSAGVKTVEAVKTMGDQKLIAGPTGGI